METLQNLAKAFIGESQARNRYTIYAKIAKKEGYEQIADIFLQTAEQETEHAKWLFRLIQDLKGSEKIEVMTDLPDVLGNTIENLEAAINGENHEYTSMYPEYAEIAEKEGHSEIANRLRSISIAESHHEDRYKRLLTQLKDETIFKKEITTEWICRKCGYAHKGKMPPVACPSCAHPIAYFEVRNENY